MTLDDYKTASIAIGKVAAARKLVEDAQDAVEYIYHNDYREDFSKVWTALNEIVCSLNEELDQETVDTKKEDDQ